MIGCYGKPLFRSGFLFSKQNSAIRSINAQNNASGFHEHYHILGFLQGLNLVET